MDARGTTRYRVVYDGTTLHETGSGRLAVSAELDLEAGTDGSLKVVLGPDHPLSGIYRDAFRVMDPSSEVRVYQDDVELFRGRITSVGGDLTNCATIEAEGQLAYLRDTIVPPVANYRDDSFPKGTQDISDDPFHWLLENHNQRGGPQKSFQRGLDPGWSFPFSATEWGKTRDVMEDALCKGGFTFLNARTGEGDARILDLVDDGVGDTTQAVVVGENMLDLAEWRGADDVVTCITAVGRYPEEGSQSASSTWDPRMDDSPKAELPEGESPSYENYDPDRDITRQLDDDRTFGLETVDDGAYSIGSTRLQVNGTSAQCPDLVALYGVIEERREYDAQSPEELLSAVAGDLDPTGPLSRELVSIDVSAVDLHEANPDVQPIRILDWTRLYCPSAGLDQWLPCTKAHIDLCRPGRSTYHFGDLPETLTRQNALRVARARRGTGSLIRRLDTAKWSTERAWDKGQQTQDRVDRTDDHISRVEGVVDENKQETDKRIDGLIDGLDQIGDGIIDLERNFNASIDGLEELMNAGIEQAGTDLKELEKEMGGRIDGLDGLLGETDAKIDGLATKTEGDIGAVRDEMGQLSERTDGRLGNLDTAVKSAAEAAMEAMYSSVYRGTCSTAAGTAAKVVSDAAAQNKRAFALEKGVLLLVTFSEANTASAPSLAVNGTAAKPIRTNGVSVAWWAAGQTVALAYDGNVWTTPSSPVWATELTAGNPLGFNFHTDGSKAAMRYGEQSYITADGSGIQVGFTAVGTGTQKVGTRNVYIGSNRMAMRQGQTEYMSFDDDGIQVGIDGYPNVHIGSSSVVFRYKGYDYVVIDSDGLHFKNTQGTETLRVGSPYTSVPSSSSPVLGLTSKYDAAVQSDSRVILASPKIAISRNVNLSTASSVDISMECAPSINLNGTSTISINKDSNISVYGTTNIDLRAGNNCLRLNGHPIVFRSFNVTGTGRNYVEVSASLLGISSCNGYAWIVTNGNFDANNVTVTGASYNTTTHGIRVSFDSIVYGTCQLNFVGFYTYIYGAASDPEEPDDSGVV